MRIIAGKYKSRSLFYPKNRSCRPTQDRVREALFSILGNRVSGSRFLDLFAGSGSVGFEALSRGAKEVVLADKDVTFLIKNRSIFEEKVRIIRKTFKQALKMPLGKFDLIYIDPPYDLISGYEASLKVIGDSDILQNGALVVCEQKLHATYDIGSFTEKSRYCYGDTELVIYHLETEL